MSIAHSPHNPLNLANLQPSGVCDRCDFLYPLSKLTEQRQWAGTTVVSLGIRCCPRCLDDLQENGFRTIVIGPDPRPLKNPRVPSWAQQAAPSLAPQFVLEDVIVNEAEGDGQLDTFVLDRDTPV
jgi:hypothetical protein